MTNLEITLSVAGCTVVVNLEGVWCSAKAKHCNTKGDSPTIWSTDVRYGVHWIQMQENAQESCRSIGILKVGCICSGIAQLETDPS